MADRSVVGRGLKSLGRVVAAIVALACWYSWILQVLLVVSQILQDIMLIEPLRLGNN